MTTCWRLRKLAIEEAIMPTGPNGEKRPSDPNQLGKLIVEIATGQVEETPVPQSPPKRKRPRQDSNLQPRP